MRAMAAVLPVAALILSACRPASAAKPFVKYTDCVACVKAGFGWKLSSQKCGGYKNKECPSAEAASSGGAGAAPETGHTAIGFIERNQNPASCKTARYFHLNTDTILGKPYDSRGFAALVREMSLCFVVATLQRRVFLVDGEIGNYGDSLKLLKPLSKCTLADMKKANPENVHVNQADPRDRISDCARAMEAHTGWSGGKRDLQMRRKGDYWEEMGPQVVPYHFAQTGYSFQSWMGAHQRWMLRPGKSVQTNIDQLKKKLGYPEGGAGVTGVHIRHGDRARDLKASGVAAGQPPGEFFAPVFDLKKHVAKLRDKRLSPVTTIFLATDTDDTSKAAESDIDRMNAEHEGELPLKLLSNNKAMREGDRLVDKRTKKKIALAGVVTFMKPNKRFRIATEIMSDVWLLADSDFMIGQCWSGVSALSSSMYMSRNLDEFGGIAHLPISIGSACSGFNWWPDARDFLNYQGNRNSLWMGGWAHDAKHGLFTHVPTTSGGDAHFDQCRAKVGTESGDDRHEALNSMHAHMLPAASKVGVTSARLHEQLVSEYGEFKLA